MKMLYISNKMELFSYSSEWGVHLSKHLKEELVWAIDKEDWLINIVLLPLVTV